MSQGWIEGRIAAVEQRVEWLIRQVQDLIPQLRNAAQSARAASATYGGGGGGAATGAFYCMPSAGVAGSTGTWPAISGTGFTADVYVANGITLVLSAAAANCYNFNAAPLVASKIVDLVPDGQGNFNAYTQSCV